MVFPKCLWSSDQGRPGLSFQRSAPPAAFLPKLWGYRNPEETQEKILIIETEACSGQTRPKLAMGAMHFLPTTVVLKGWFFRIRSESNFHGDLRTESLGLDQPFPSNLLKTDFGLKMAIHKCLTKQQWRNMRSKYQKQVVNTLLYRIQDPADWPICEEAFNQGDSLWISGVSWIQISALD